jgi:hypothetical protein
LILASQRFDLSQMNLFLLLDIFLKGEDLVDKSREPSTEVIKIISLCGDALEHLVVKGEPLHGWAPLDLFVDFCERSLECLEHFWDDL